MFKKTVVLNVCVFLCSYALEFLNEDNDKCLEIFRNGSY